jgi:hypothetical protein
MARYAEWVDSNAKSIVWWALALFGEGMWFVGCALHSLHGKWSFETQVVIVGSKGGPGTLPLSAVALLVAGSWLAGIVFLISLIGLRRGWLKSPEGQRK